MKLLFVADPLEAFNVKKDSTFAMMREAARRGHALFACEAKDLMWQRGARVSTHVREIALTGGKAPWFIELEPEGERARVALADFGAVLMRTDPPFDSEYFYATHLLEQAEREGAKVFNRPEALRNHPEKLAILEFPQFIAPTLVTRDPDELKRFHAMHGDVILKPLDGMGGAGIFRVGTDGMNLGSVVETLNARGRHTVMAQRYVPEIVAHDRRAPPSIEQIASHIGECRVDVVPVPHDCVDGFLAAYWRRPEAYLDPKVRAGMSGFARLSDAVVARGVARLKSDLDSGEWERRFGDLRRLDALDAGYRLVVRAAAPSASGR